MNSIGPLPQRATLADLAKVEEKAELIGGNVIRHLAAGFRPNILAGRIFRSLASHADATGTGFAFTDNIGFAIMELPSGRESFSPDAAYYFGPSPENEMRFVEGPPDLAVEVRSEGDYGPSAEMRMTEKRTDYFAAGTKVVWDVDPLAATIDSHRNDLPDSPTRFVRGQHADAEPAVPGWRVAIDWVMG